MKQVGIIGWRGMVGSVLLDRMREEKDFDLIAPDLLQHFAGGRGGTDDWVHRRDRAGRQRHRRARQAAHADQRAGRRLHQGGASAPARRRMAGLLDRRGLGAAHGKERRHRARSGESAGHAGGARAGHQGFHRRQLHRLAHADGGCRTAAGRRRRMDHRDDLPVRVGRRRAEHARDARADGSAARARLRRC